MPEFEISDLACEWAALHKGSQAPQPAVTFLPHPVLAAVPVCETCCRMFMVTPTATSTRVKGLSSLNVMALRELLAPWIEAKSIELTATTATFHINNAAKFLREVAAKLPGRGHPRASLHAIVRKLEASS